MENNSGKRAKARFNRVIVTLIAVLLLLIVMAVVLPNNAGNEMGSTGTGETTSTAPMAEMIIHSVQEQGEWIYVSTSYCDFRYPFAFSDLITVEACSEADRVALIFSAHMNETFEPLYTLWINGGEGHPAGFLSVDGQSYQMNVEFHSPRGDLVSEYLPTFYAAQETLNDVLNSMLDAGIFTYTD